MRSRFDRLREEREARQAELAEDKKTRLAVEARPFADNPFGLTAFEDTVRGRARPDFESYGLALMLFGGNPWRPLGRLRHSRSPTILMGSRFSLAVAWSGGLPPMHCAVT